MAGKSIGAISSGLTWRLRMLIGYDGMHSLFLMRAIVGILRKWPPKSFGTVMDYGCGNRPYNTELLRIAKTVTGIDIGDNPAADIRLNSGDSLPMETASVDMVISSQVLEHVAAPHHYLAEANRVLKPDGYMVMGVPFVWPYHPYPQDYRRWTLQGLELDLGKAGFAVESAVPVLNTFSTGLQYLLSGLGYALAGRNAALLLLGRLIALNMNVVILLSEKMHRPDPGRGGNLVVLVRKVHALDPKVAIHV